ncbi:MAG: hypothetical protein ACOC5T_09760, partial [Elusimicrobiota bacterium]
MQRKTNVAGWISVVLLLVVLIYGAFLSSSINSIKNEEGLSSEDIRAIVGDELADRLANRSDLPTAEEIAEKMETIDKERFNDVFEKVYSTEISNLENEAETAYNNEYSEDDLEEALEDLIENFDFLVDADEEESEVEVINLGLDDEENQRAIVEKEYDIRYENTENE